MVDKILQPDSNQLLFADPTVIGPQDSPDGKWYLFCYSVLGIHNFVSLDGHKWQPGKLIMFSTFNTPKTSTKLTATGIQIPALASYAVQVVKNKTGYVEAPVRPFLLKTGKLYRLYYQELKFFWQDRRFRLHPESSIKSISSSDLETWSDPAIDLAENQQFPQPASPSVVFENNVYKMYFTYGQKLTGDASLMEPVRVAMAKSRRPDSMFTGQTEVRISQNDHPVKQIGSFRARKINFNEYYSCNPIEQHEGYSASKLFWAKKIDEKTFRLEDPLVPKNDLARFSIGETYVADIVSSQDQATVYFNGRQTNHFFDRIKADGTVGNILLLALKNIYFNRESIYSKQFSKSSSHNSPDAKSPVR